MQIFTAAQINSTPSLKNYLFLVPTKKRRIENAYTCNLYSLKLTYWQTIQRESNYCPSIRIDGTTIGTKYFDRQGLISFEETGDGMAQRVNFLDINSFENYYVPRKNRFFAGEKRTCTTLV